MSVRVILIFSLVLIALNTRAQSADWFRQMIVEKEQSSGPKQFAANPKKSQGFFSTHGLVLFYGSHCPHCQRFAPIIKRWSTHHKVDVLPLSIDNQPLSEFPNFLPATTEWINVAFEGKPIHYPALFLIHSKSHTLYPVSFGSMTEAELNERMAFIISKIKTYETRGEVE